MKWVLFTMLLCAVGPTQASAQNEISQQLLELDQDQRNAAFTHMLWDSKRKCDHVIRTLLMAPSWAWTTGRCFAATDARTQLASL